MNKNLTQVGDALVIEIDKTTLVIDKSILALLKVSPDTKLCIKADGKKIVLVPVQEAMEAAINEAADLQKRTEKIIEKHKVMFKKLAE
jgi:hypothetical protein